MKPVVYMLPQSKPTFQKTYHVTNVKYFQAQEST